MKFRPSCGARDETRLRSHGCRRVFANFVIVGEKTVRSQSVEADGTVCLKHRFGTEKVNNYHTSICPDNRPKQPLFFLKLRLEMAAGEWQISR